MELVYQVTALFAQIDKDVAQFQLKSGLRCSRGCGTCCPGADVQTTLLEMLPAAREILHRGTAAFWLERIAAQSPPDLCVFYQLHPPPEASGNCEFYPWRPMVCRLFGYAAVQDRHAQRALAACKHLKQADPASVAAAVKLAAEAPCFVQYGAQVYALDPGLGTRQLPINAALRQAIERMGLRMQMGYTETLGSSTAA